MSLKSYFLLFIISILSWTLTAQTSRVEFGKNRIQFHNAFQEWQYYEADNTITYWYGNGRYIGQAASIIAESEIESIKDLLEHSINDKIEIVVYTDLTDLKQTNIGQEEAFQYTGGLTKIAGNKIFVYFNGNHRDLRRQVRQGIASIYLESILFGANLQEIVQNAVSFNLPDWFKNGLISYVGQEWSITQDNELRDFFQHNKIKNFDKLISYDANLAGHAFWYYVSQSFGLTSVANLLYLVRINRSLDAGFEYVLGNDYKIVSENLMTYYSNKYLPEVPDKLLESGENIYIPKANRVKLSKIAVSDDGQKLAFITNQIGKTRLYYYDLRTGKRKYLFFKGFKNAFQPTDYEYPHLAWNNSGTELLVLTEEKDKQKIGRYDVVTEKWTWEPVAPHFDRIHSIDYLDNSRLIVTATYNGVSDVYLYYLATRQAVKLTSDFYDDIDAIRVNLLGKKGILFVSNRPNTELVTNRIDSIIPLDKMDIFYMDPDANPLKIIRITNTPDYNEINPQRIDSLHFAYMTEENGTWARKIGKLKNIITDTVQNIYFKDGTKIIVPIDSLIPTLKRKEIDTITFSPVIETVSETDWQKAFTLPVQRIFGIDTTAFVYYLYQNNPVLKRVTIPKTTIPEPPITPYRKESNTRMLLQRQSVILKSEPNKAKVEEPKEKEIIVQKDTAKQIKKSYFQTGFDDDEPAPSIVTIKKTEPLIEEKTDLPITPTKRYIFRSARIVPYRLQFKTDFITTRLDNSPLFGGLDNYVGRQLTGQGNGGSFSYTPLGILLTTNFKDLLEDYVFEVGARFPTTFRGAEYFITFKDRKHRWDKNYSYYYSGQQYIIDPASIDNNFIKSLPPALQFPLPTASTLFPQLRSNVITNLAQVEFRYPFDIYRSLRLRTLIRNDRMYWKISEGKTLNTSVYNEQRLGLRAEYVFDNTFEYALNLLHGTRYKVYGEFVKQFAIQFESPTSFKFNKGYLGMIGLDFRHYEPILRHSIIALRVAGEISFGTEKILYLMGGVDNWLLPKFESSIPITNDQSYAYQTVVTNIRGFNYNIRNGSSYGLLNLELRIPVFRYFSNKIRSGFIRNFQIVGFFDAGTAWDGFSPFQKDSPLNTIYLENPPTVKLKVNYYRDPLVAGFGFGARTSVFGYFVRADYTYGIETKKIGNPIFYLAFGTDF